jgi:transposase
LYWPRPPSADLFQKSSFTIAYQIHSPRYSQYCVNYRQWTKTLKRSMRQIHKAGEKLFVDFAGPTMGLPDGSRAHWIEGMSGALHYMGGVAQLIAPDNPRAVIVQNDRYEHRATDSELDFALHYGTSIRPARPRTPQDKAKVESAVQDVNLAITPLLKDLNARLFQNLPGSRLSVFTELDAPAAH